MKTGAEWQQIWLEPSWKGISSLSSFLPRPLVIAHLVALVELKKMPKPTLKTSLLVPTGSGKGFESLLEHDSKAHPPFVCPRSLAYMHIQLLEVWAKRDGVHASG